MGEVQGIHPSHVTASAGRRGALFQHFERAAVSGFVGAIGIYAIAGSAAPTAPGPVEYVVAAFLMVSVGFGMLNPSRPDRDHQVAACVFIALLWIGLLRGLSLGHGIGDVIRDIIPLMFLFMPVFIILSGAGAGAGASDGTIERLRAVAVACGATIALRDVVGIGLTAVGRGGAAPPIVPEFPSGSALIVFAGLSLWSCALRPQSPIRIRCLFLSLAGICLLALLLSGYRAQLIVLLTAALVVWFDHDRRAPRGSPRERVIFGIVLLASITLAALVVVPKTLAVGDNARIAEIASIVAMMQESPLGVLFGYGWGATYVSPAASRDMVGFAHVFLGYAALKTGLVGMAVIVPFLFTLARRLVLISRFDLTFSLALIASMLPALTVHTGFKHLDLGVLIVLCFSAPARD